MNKLTTKQWFLLMVFFAFASVISFFQIDSAWADENNFNGFKGFLGIGIVSGFLAILSYLKAKQNS
jgi:hypothetical protein